MSNIEENLKKILNSRFGKDVRQAIHDGIHDCYEDGKAGAVDLTARERIEEAITTEKSERQAADATEKSERMQEIAVERARINNLVANNNPTEGNSELIDIRIGADGNEYSTAGEAVRKQISRAEFANTQLGVRFQKGYILSNGDIGPESETRLVSYPILCNEGVEVEFLGEYNESEYVLTIAFYDEYGNFIKGEKQSVNGDIDRTTSPAGTKYMRIGYFPTVLNYWYLYIHDSTITNWILTSSLENETKFSNKLDKKIGKNIFNKDDILDGSFYIAANGAIVPTEYEYYTSNFIEVKPGVMYTLKNAASGGGSPYAEYDLNGAFISAGTASNSALTFTTNERTAFIRVSNFTSTLDTQQLELGSKSTDYEEYTEYEPVTENKKDIEMIKNALDLGGSVELEVVLPTELYSIKNTSLPLYFENILMKNLSDPGDVHINVGKKTGRLQKINLSSSGRSSISAIVSKTLSKVKTQNFNLNVVDDAANSGKTINLLCIGDSFTDMGIYVSVLEQLLEDSDAIVNLIGTCGTADCKHEGLSGGIIKNTFLDSSSGVARIVDVTGVTEAPNTTYPGGTYQDSTGKQWAIRGSKINPDGSGKMVVTNFGAVESDFDSFPNSGILTKISSGNGDPTISYSNPVKAYYNPFINGLTGELDVTGYLSTWEFSNPDIVVLQFTYNDIPEWATEEQLSSVTNDFVTAVQSLHSALPSAKIIISVEPYGAINTSNDWNGKKKAVLQWVQKLKTAFETEAYEDYVRIAPSYACVDMLYGYSDSVITPSIRYPNVTESGSGDGVHPSSKGMSQIADCIYPVITGMLSS